MKRIFLILVLLKIFSNMAVAETPLFVELNKLVQSGKDCSMIFTAQSNDTVDRLILETVLFDNNEGVILLTLFDFENLPKEKLRVRQFDIPETMCDDIGKLLFNAINTCKGLGCGPLSISSRIEMVDVLG